MDEVLQFFAKKSSSLSDVPEILEIAFLFDILYIGGFIFFYVHLYLGKIPIWTNICQMGWKHQLEYFSGLEQKVIGSLVFFLGWWFMTNRRINLIDLKKNPGSLSHVVGNARNLWVTKLISAPCLLWVWGEFD